MRPLIIANWKMNPQTEKEAKQLFDLVKKGIGKIKKTEVVICPPFVFLPNVKYQTSNVKLGAQNCFWEKEGAYTGEVSSIMLKSLGCQYIIVGHSERKKYFKETDETVNKKLKSILGAKLSPILCIGETQEQREQAKTDTVLKNQIISALKNISKSKFPEITIAYEPIWAIGSGNSCNIEDAQKIGLLIKKIISNLSNIKIAEKIRILYGGSVNSKNAEGYIKEAGLNGLLIGGASLKAGEFVKIIKSTV